ncbi:MAG: DUF1566 domain-containing protein, partial [Chloroflexi bacterium]|nr:DUF1566 domain-containing protein [Chloroflexota bacterium]
VMVEKLKNVAWLLLGGIALFWAVTTFPGMIFGAGGSLDPSAPPAPSMKTLAEIPPSWHQILPAGDGDLLGCNSSRFKCEMKNGEAVLDLETGLVWERSPDTIIVPRSNAQSNCSSKEVGNRLGWRLPTVQELATLVDTTQLNPALPSGHPFINVQNARYWSASTHAVESTFAMAVRFMNAGTVTAAKNQLLNWWCVRGATGGYDGGH